MVGLVRGDRTFPQVDKGCESVVLEKYDPIGGKRFVVLEIKVGEGERIDPSINNVTVRVTEESNLHDLLQNHKDLATLNLTTHEGWQKKINPCNAQSGWVDLPSGETPKDDNSAGSSAIVYRAKVLWNTTTEPLGHNGTHTVSLSAVNGDTAVTKISFQRYVVGEGWQAPYASGPAPKFAQVKNLVIKYDPAETAPAEQRSPAFSFDIDDGTDEGEYVWAIYMRPTPSADRSVQGDAYLRKTETAPGATGKSWNGQKNDNTGDLQPRNTYTFDIVVWEVENAQAFINDPNLP